MAVHIFMPWIPGPILGVMALVMVAALSLAFPELRQKAYAKRIIAGLIVAVMLSAGLWAQAVSYNCNTSDWFLYLAGFCWAY
jgi:predicted Na+-dependent transporter